MRNWLSAKPKRRGPAAIPVRCAASDGLAVFCVGDARQLLIGPTALLARIDLSSLRSDAVMLGRSNRHRRPVPTARTPAPRSGRLVRQPVIGAARRSSAGRRIGKLFVVTPGGLLSDHGRSL